MTHSPEAAAEQQPVNPEKGPNIDRAILAAVGAIQSGDGADYGSALWEVLCALDPQSAEILDKGTREEKAALYDKARARVYPVV